MIWETQKKILGAKGESRWSVYQLNIRMKYVYIYSLTIPFVKNKKIWTEATSWNAVYSEDPPNMNDIGKLED